MKFEVTGKMDTVSVQFYMKANNLMEAAQLADDFVRENFPKSVNQMQVKEWKPS